MQMGKRAVDLDVECFLLDASGLVARSKIELSPKPKYWIGCIYIAVDHDKPPGSEKRWQQLL